MPVCDEAVRAEFEVIATKSDGEIKVRRVSRPIEHILPPEVASWVVDLAGDFDVNKVRVSMTVYDNRNIKKVVRIHVPIIRADIKDPADVADHDDSFEASAAV